MSNDDGLGWTCGSVTCLHAVPSEKSTTSTSNSTNDTVDCHVCIATSDGRIHLWSITSNASTTRSTSNADDSSYGVLELLASLSVASFGGLDQCIDCICMSTLIQCGVNTLLFWSWLGGNLAPTHVEAKLSPDDKIFALAAADKKNSLYLSQRPVKEVQSQVCNSLSQRGSHAARLLCRGWLLYAKRR